MDEATLLAIAVIVALIAIAAVWSFLIGPSSPFAAGWRQQLHELEVKVRMGTGESLIQDLRALAQIQRRLGNRFEAEKTLRRALLTSQQQWGARSPHNSEIMGELATLLDSMHRQAEAQVVRKQMKELK